MPGWLTPAEPEGRLILSGILADQEQRVVDAEARGSLADRRQMGGLGGVDVRARQNMSREKEPGRSMVPFTSRVLVN
jgi:hypothetical protein